MFDRSNRFNLALLIGLAAISLAALPVVAQESPEVTDQMIEQAMQRSFEGEVTVTGSLIPRADLTALSPVSIMEVPTELTYSGTVRIEDLVRTMPQAFSGQNSTVANGATGTATIDLRQLGTYRTLVLINGRRMPPGDASGGYAPDLNVIPAPLVKRVDVLTGGASTTYGSDAVSGVVNFVMDTDFEGVRGGVQYGGFYHDNNNDTAQRINEEVGFDYPTGFDFDGEAVNANIAVGGKFADGKGHAAAYIDYRKLEQLVKGQRDYLNCSVAAGDDGPFCGGSGTSAQGRFRPFRADGSTYSPRDYTVVGNEFVAGIPLFNYAPYNHIQRPDEKWNAGVFANYEINRHFDVYIEVMYMNNYTEANIAPSGNFNNVQQINCDNPMLSPQQHDLLCGPDSGYGPTDYANTWIFRRNVEGAPRSNALGHTNVRMLAGVRGEIGDNWNYDFYYMNGQNNQYDSYNNDLNITRIGYALDVIEDPDTGEWVCRNDAGNGCVPWNIFINNGNQLVDDPRQGVTQAAIDYMSTVAVQYGVTSVEVINLTFTSDWENYGIAIPGASEGVQAAIGAEYREEFFENTPDEVYRTANAAGFGGATEVISGGFNVTEGFIELLVPIVQDVKGAQDLSLELGYRYSDYSTSGGVSTYKGQLSYAPTESWRLRGGYNRAIRAANLFELYRPQGFNLSGSTDICSGDNPTATLEQCIRTGVTPEQYGFIAPNPAGQYNTLEGGNSLLEPETADTLTAGIVWTPQGIRGLSVTVDYYNIEIEEAIGSLGADDIIQQCANTGDPLLCSLIHRDAQGTLWATQQGFTVTTNQNIGLLEAEGIDLNANYLLGLGDAGYLAMDLMGTYVLTNSFTNPLVSYDCVGYFGFQCGGPVPEWRHRFRATWESNFRLNLSLAWRYLGGTDNDDASSDTDLGNPGNMELWETNDIAEIDPFNWFDFAASYTLRNGLKFTLGINNFLDEEPPLAPDHADDTGINMYAQYEPAGRYIFGSVQFNF
ncbi:MAG: TonB-dependent receptor [Thermoanaerobaculales bacterium]|jgi:outer membrane receptor protein involved in Fe transport|nr:TonB-dependent receptor [Thermoanaerobaculales bacterium]